MKVTPKVVQILEHPTQGSWPGYTIVLYDDGAVFERMTAPGAEWCRVEMPAREAVDVVDPNGEAEHPEGTKDPVVFMPGEGPSYAQTVRRFLDAPGAVRVTEWPTIVALLERELEAEQTITVYGERTGGTAREARAEARGRFSGLKTAARAIREAAERGRSPSNGSVYHSLGELAAALERIAEEAKP